MSASWPMVRLGEVLQIANRSVNASTLSNMPLAGMMSFGKGLFKRGLHDPSSSSYRYYNRLITGDFVISQPKAWEGALGMVTSEFDGWYLSPVFPVFHPKSTLDIRYLDWFCKREVFWKSLQALSKGMGARRETVSELSFLSLEIPLPPLEEQWRIVARIEEVATRVESVRRLQAEQAVQAESLILSLHESLAAGRELELSEFLELYEDQEPVQLEGAYPQVGVRSFGQGLFPKDAVLGSGTTYRAFNRLYEGAIVLSQVKGWEGALSVCSKDLVGKFVSPEYRTFRCKTEQALPEYLKYLLPTEWFWGRLGDATRGQGARRERTRPEQFLKVRITLPKVEMQAVAIQAFHTARAALQGRSTSEGELDALLPSFLDRAFRGEI